MKRSSNKFRYQYLLSATFFVLALLLSLSSCEYEINDLHESQANTANPLPFETKSIALKDVPEVENYITSIIGDISQKGKTSKSNAISLDATFEVEKILETIDTIKNKNYNIRFTFKDTPEHIFYNLIVNFLPNGEKHAFVERYTCNPESYLVYRNSRYNMNYFTGKVDLFYYTSFFDKQSIKEKGKSAIDCVPKYYPNGDPVPTVSSFITSGSSVSSGGTQMYTGTPFGNRPPATYGQGLHVSISTPSTAGDGCCSCGDCGLHWYPPTRKSEHVTEKTSNDPCPDIIPVGFIGIKAEPEQLQILRAELAISLQHWQWLHGKDEFSKLILDYIRTSNDKNKAKQASLAALDFSVNKTKVEYLFALSLLKEQIANPNLFFDINASFKSPMNIDLSSIPYDITKPEYQKFNEIYDDALTKSPTFKQLFVDIFKDSKRFNVKFEIVDHVYEKNDPTKNEVHATTSEDPVTRNIVIKISKQILSPDGTMKQTKIENAKTILHECIHAYLFVKAGNPNVGVDFVSMLNEMYPTPLAQHDFMYNNMIPTMQKVLGEIRDLVTTTPKRTILEGYTMHPTINPLTNAPFNWADFYKFISYSGLDEASCFKEYVLKDSNLLSLFNQYVTAGKIELDR